LPESIQQKIAKDKQVSENLVSAIERNDVKAFKENIKLGRQNIKDLTRDTSKIIERKESVLLKSKIKTSRLCSRLYNHI